MDSLAHKNTQVLAHYLFRLAGEKGRSAEHWRRAEQLLNDNIFGDPPKTHSHASGIEFPANAPLQVVAEYL